jgi:dephospho-CoA kinase
MLTAKKALIVGLTGPIGAGKTTVAGLLRARGVPVVDADALGRELLESSSRFKGELAAAFGPSILTADGAVDRRALARVAFASKETAARLNALIHPLLWDRIKGEIAEQKGADIIVIDAALIVEWIKSLHVDVVVVVDAPQDVRKERSRHKYDGDDFDARQARQIDAAGKRAEADIIVNNDGSEEELKEKVDVLFRALKDKVNDKNLPVEPLII